MDKREPSVTRLRYVSAVRKEEVAIRKLLLHFPFPSFQSMKAVNCKTYSTFREAAIARGLYAEGEEFHVTMDSCIKEHCTPEDMRKLLVMMFQEGANPLLLYNAFRDFLSSDIQKPDPEQRNQELLQRLLSISDRHGGKLLRNFPGFPVPKSMKARTEALQLETYIRGLQQKECAEEIRQQYCSLKTQQKAVVDEVLQVLRKKRSFASSGE